MAEEFVTSSGVTIPLRRVSQVYIERIYAREELQLPKVPTYEAELLGGGTQTFHLDKDSLETPEDKEKWLEFESAREHIIAERLHAVAEFLLFNCIDMEAPPVDEWSVDFDMWDFERPDPEDEKGFKLQWIECELLSDPDDYAAIMAKLYGMAGIVEESKIQEFEQFFRLALGRDQTR